MKTLFVSVILLFNLQAFSQDYLLTKAGEKIEFSNYKLDESAIVLKIKGEKEKRSIKWQDVLQVCDGKKCRYVKPDQGHDIYREYDLVEKEIEGKITMYTELVSSGNLRNLYIYFEKESVGYKHIMTTNTIRGDAEKNRIKEALKSFFSDDPETLKLIKGDFKPNYDNLKEFVTKYNSKS
jgi:hypothetical protein